MQDGKDSTNTAGGTMDGECLEQSARRYAQVHGVKRDMNINWGRIE